MITTINAHPDEQTEIDVSILGSEERRFVNVALDDLNVMCGDVLTCNRLAQAFHEAGAQLLGALNPELAEENA